LYLQTHSALEQLFCSFLYWKMMRYLMQGGSQIQVTRKIRMVALMNGETQKMSGVINV
jgi:hypothetical protein